MRPPAFSTPGRFFRGALHTHSTRSDGALAPEEVCRRYRAEGYDFIALTDHFIGLFGYPITDTEAFRADGFTTLLGAEIHSGAMANGELWHLLAVGLPADFAPGDAPHFMHVDGMETGPDFARRARDAGAFVAIAHPEWSGLTEADARSIEAAHAVEIYNHGCAVDSDRPHGFAALDLLLTEGRRLNLIATDDAHFHAPDAFGGWVMVKTESNEPEALLEVLKSGAFYASTGPEIRDVTLDGKMLTVECSAAETIIVMGAGSATQSLWGASMSRAEIKLARVSESPWIRVAVIDRAGKRAWSNPIWRD